MNGAYLQPFAITPSTTTQPAFDPYDGLDLELSFLTAQIAAGAPIPLGLAIQTLGTAIAIVFVATTALEALGLKGRLAASAIAVLAPLAIDVARRKAGR